jgi:hypothetical protein
MAVKTKRNRREIPVLKKSTKTRRIIPKDTVEVANPPAVGSVVERSPKVIYPEHPAKEHKVETLKLPPLNDFPVNLVELPRSIINLSGEGLLSDIVGERNKKEIITLHKLLKNGWKVHSVQSTDRNSFLFVLVK